MNSLTSSSVPAHAVETSADGRARSGDAAYARDGGPGARPVPVRTPSGFRAVPVAAEPPPLSASYRTLLTEFVRATPQDAVAAQALCLASRPQSGVPVVFTGVDGAAGRTTLCRETARAAGALYGSGGAVAVDAVSVWGRLTRELDQSGGPRGWSIGAAAAAGWLPGREDLAGLRSAEGVLTLPAQWPGEAPAVAEQVLEVIGRLRPATSVIAVDGPADPAGLVARSIAAWPHGGVVIVEPGTVTGVWAARQAALYFEGAGLRDRRHLVIALRGVAKRWPDEARAAAQQIAGDGFESIEIPYLPERGREAGKHARELGEAAVRLLAAVLARARPDEPAPAEHPPRYTYAAPEPAAPINPFLTPKGAQR